MINQNSSSIKWLATLRGIFVLLVFVSHELTPIVNKDILLAVGKIGVAGFFLISGYLAKTSIEKRNIKQFLFNRFVRLYPVYWILLLLSVFTSIITHDRIWSVYEILANMTFFHQYMGFENIIGSSWMLSIMVIFFVSIVLIVKKTSKADLLFLIFAIGAVVCGYLRFHFLKPFPTAIFLMTCMGIFGFHYHKYGFCKKNIFNLILFEITLAISAYLSYQDKILFYEIAYNGAFLLFFLFSVKNIGMGIFDKLGQLGFTFFLGAGIPSALWIYAFPSLKLNFGLFFIIHFVLCILFSWFVTKFIENPIIQRAKELEKRIK